MGWFNQVRDWFSGGAPNERLAALVCDDEPWHPGLYGPSGTAAGKIVYTTNPRLADDPLFLTQLVFRLHEIWRAPQGAGTLAEHCARNLLRTAIQPGFVAPLVAEVSGAEGVFLHDVEWRTHDHRDWTWWRPNHGLRRIRLDTQGQVRGIRPAEPGDAACYARRRIRLLRAQGAQEATVHLVQAHGDLYASGAEDLPAVGIFSDDPEADPGELQDLAARLYSFRDEDETPAELAEGLALLHANAVRGWRYHRRARAQAGKPHFVADLFLPREFLRHGYLQDRTLRCVKEPGETGGIELLPYNSEVGPEVTWERSWVGWNDGTVLRMAHTIAEASTYRDLPVLGDALEEAGCDSAEILEHCRAGLPHQHNCWVIDGLVSLGGRPA